MPEQQTANPKQDPKRTPEPSASAEPKKPVTTASGEPIVIDYNTRILAPPHDEIEAAAFYLRKHFPEIPEEVMQETLCDRINVEGLNKGSVIYIAVRKSYGRKRLTESQSYREGLDGARITVHTGYDVLAEEIKVFGPIKVRDHWEETPNGWSSEINRSSFICEVGKLSAPWAVIQPDAPGKKAGELPKFIRLSSC